MKVFTSIISTDDESKLSELKRDFNKISNGVFLLQMLLEMVFCFEWQCQLKKTFLGKSPLSLLEKGTVVLDYHYYFV